MKLLVIDSGTTNSRVRLMDGDRIAASVSRSVGSRDVAIAGHTEVLERALREAIAEIVSSNSISLEDIEAIVASGMITSNMGLMDIPHLPAPATAAQVAAGIVERIFPAVAPKPIHFIPGVKTGFIGEAELSRKDMMRGEEAEVFGFMAHSGDAAQEPQVFMHYGSHHKAILLEGGEIKRCSTSVTGELMMAILQSTILKSSLPSPAEMRPDLKQVRTGLAIAEAAGFGRAIFSSRVLNVMERRDRQEAAGIFLGALLSLDLAMLNDLLTPDIRKLVLYGKALFPSIFKPIVQERHPYLEITVVPEEQSDTLSAQGAVILYRHYKSGMR